MSCEVKAKSESVIGPGPIQVSIFRSLWGGIVDEHEADLSPTAIGPLFCDGKVCCIERFGGKNRASVQRCSSVPPFMSDLRHADGRGPGCLSRQRWA